MFYRKRDGHENEMLFGSAVISSTLLKTHPSSCFMDYG